MNDIGSLSSGLVGAVYAVGQQDLEGYVFEARDVSRRFVVELLADGLPIGLTRADSYNAELGSGGVGDGCYGFVFALKDAVLASGVTLEIRLANSGEIIGAPLSLTPVPDPGRSRQETSHVGWIGGLRLQGWIQGAARPLASRVKALIDGRIVAEASLNGWTHVRRGDSFDVAPAFDLHLPQRFADGRVRSVEVMSNEGQVLGGSPCFVVAFPDGLEAFIDGVASLESEKMRARYFDRLLPQSLPFSALRDWMDHFPLVLQDGNRPGPIGVVLIGENGLDDSLASLAATKGCAWIAAALPQADGAVTFRATDLAHFLGSDGQDLDRFVFAPAGTRFEAAALALLHDALDAFPKAHSAYGDLIVGADGAPWPLALPAFDYERCLGQGYCAFVFVMRRGAVEAAILRGADSLFALFHAQLDASAGEAAMPVHVPGLLARRPDLPQQDIEHALLGAAARHLDGRSLKADLCVNAAAAIPSIRIGRRPAPRRVSILVPTRNQPALLNRCLTSLQDTLGRIDFELLIIDNDSTDEKALTLLRAAAAAGARILRVPGVFNFARMNNRAAAIAAGEDLLFLNNDVEALEPGWLEELQGRLAEPDVGAVAPLLLYPSGVVQHAGIVLGPNLSAAHAGLGHMAGEPGYAGLVEVAHECSAVTAACLLTRKSLFLAQGGFDERYFAIDYNDVDYCLKLRAAGYRIIFTPYAKLRHAEGFSRGAHHRADQRQRYDRELANLRQRWGDVLLDDPYYNPLLSLDTVPYSALAWPPRRLAPRQRRQAPPRRIPPGF